MKKFLLFMLGVIIVLPGIARDFTYEYEGQTLTYTVLDEEAKTCKTKNGFYSNAGNLVYGTLMIPSVARDGDIEYIVTSIGGSAFKNCSGLTSVTIPNSVTSIGNQAFYECYGLTSVTIPNSVTSIGESAFSDCSGLTSVTIPSSVTSIGGSAFKNCSGLTSVTIPSSVTSIGNATFYGCSGLTSVTIPNSVTSIGESAFSDCSGLTSVTIPSSVISIGDQAFYECYGLEKSAYPNDLTNPFSNGLRIPYPRAGAIIEDGFVYGPDKSAIYFAPLSLEGEFTNPNSVTSIGEYAFYGCSRLTSVIIPPSVTSIHEYAFYGCSGLTSVTIPSSVTSIGNATFYGCSGLTSVTIPNSVTSIGGSAFSDCSGLTSVTIPSSVTSIHEYAFYGCSGLTSVTIPSSVTSIGEYAFSDCNGLKDFIVEDGKTTLAFSNDLGLGEIENLYIGRNWSAYTTGIFSSIKTVEIGTLVTKIPDYAFRHCRRLISVTIHNSVTSIGESVFSGCSGLTSVTIPNSVTSIGGRAFSGCSGLTSVTIPSSVTSIGESVFSGCSGLTSVTIPSSVTSIGKLAFSGCSGLTSVTIPSSVTSIGESVFSGCSGLTSVTIPSSVTSIGKLAFSGCSGLTSVTIPSSVTSIGGSAFSGCSGLTSVTIPTSVTSIGEFAFNKCSGLTWLIVPESVMSVGSQAFAKCSNLFSVMYLPKNPDSLSSNAFPSVSKVACYPEFADVFKNMNVNAIWTIDEGETIDAGKGIIWGANKSDCWVSGKYSGALQIPDSMTELTWDCFANCTGITEVYLPRTLESIGAKAFYGTTLKEVVIPPRVTEIHADAFSNSSPVKVACPDLLGPAVDATVVKYDAFDSKITENNFIYSRSGDVLYYAPLTVPSKFVVPEDVTEITAQAFACCEALSEIELPTKLSRLGEKVWDGCNGIVSVICNNPEPIEGEANLFTSKVYDTATLYVPKGSLSKYKVTKPWRYFLNISDEVSVDVDSIMDEDNDIIDFNAPIEVYNLHGVMVSEDVENLASGIYIVRQGKNVKKIAVK